MRLQRMICVVLLVVGCHSTANKSPPAAPAPQGHNTPEFRAVLDVSWEKPASVFDLLPRDEDRLARVQVGRRTAPPGGIVSWGDIELVRSCGVNYCVDGLTTTQERTAISRPQGQVFVAAQLTDEEREIIAGGADSWLERGIKPTFQSSEFVAYVVARAWFSHGAAASDAELICRTHPRDRPEPVTLGELWGIDVAAKAVQAVKDFLVEQREIDERAFDLAVADPMNILIESAETIVFCLPHETKASAGTIERVRVTLGRPPSPTASKTR